MKRQITPRKSCPCKMIPWNLSTNTAAEYGDLGALLHREAKQEQMTKSSSSPVAFEEQEPLHLAAQHGHVAIVAYLLNKGYDPNSGIPMDSSVAIHTSTATTNTTTNNDDNNNNTSTPPLHRACFSGSLGCIQLLLDSGADIALKDYSFGDEMTPLHKAVKGGRYRAVALLINFMKANGSLEHALQYRDKQERTPLDLAMELHTLGTDEILSLRRWDKIAGGPASFTKCIELLKDARDFHPTNENQYNTFSSLASLETLSQCCDCDNQVGVCNNISSWEKAFTKAIYESTNTLLLDQQDEYAQQDTSISPKEHDSILLNSNNLDIEPLVSSGSASDLNENHQILLGKSCQRCYKPSIALFRFSDKLLCRDCRKEKVMMILM